MFKFSTKMGILTAFSKLLLFCPVYVYVKTLGMRKTIYLLLAILLCSHDLYIKMDTYFLQPDQEATLSLYNGTFEKSENTIARYRILDASLIARGQRTPIKPEDWTDQDSTITQLNFQTGEAGTYVAGVATKARNIELSAEKFNSYLEHDGVLDMLEQRKKDNTLDEDAVESYEKHVKAIYQVGKEKTDDWSTVLGYPIEFVPQANPYDKYSGDSLEVQLLLEGNPLPDQLVFVDFLKETHTHSHNGEGEEHEHADGGHNHSHQSQEGETHTHTNGQQVRTDANGMFTVNLPEDGIYYLRTIYMTRVTDSEELTHRSKWATLTFEVSHQHGPDTHTHDHDEGHIPTWVFVLGSLLIIGALFFVFRKKS